MPVCAIYARVSDEEQVKGESIDHQISFVREFARRRSNEEQETWVTPDAYVFVDEGITGTSFLKRTAVQQLVQAARQKRFNVVLFKGISRFARDTVDALVMLRTLVAAGVRVISMEENFDSQRDNAEFIFTIHSALAQAESEKIAIRVRIGAAEKARTGRWNGAVPYGYGLNRETQKLEVDPIVAPLIRRIFDLASEGHGPWMIADKLNLAGQYTPRGAHWTRKRIREVLGNRVYAGDVVYGRREQQIAIPDDSDPMSRKKKTVFVNAPDQIVVCADAHPPIIDREQFDSIQRTLAERSTRRGRVGHQRLLTKGILVCKCGRNMSVKHNHIGVVYYACSGKMTRGKHYCDQRFLRALDLEAVVLERLRTDVQAALDIDLIHITPSNHSVTAHEIEQIDQQIAKEMRRSQLLFDRYADGQMDDDQFDSMNRTIRQRLESLRQTKQQIARQTSQAQREVDVAATLRRVMEDFLTSNSTDLHVTRQFVEALIERVEIIASNDHDVQLRIKYRFSQKPADCATH